ncbi:hypothetical protein EON63_25300 [archaeon]|nr:MAG: hypothetical protein EON63_25300 [archaeon]
MRSGIDIACIQSIFSLLYLQDFTEDKVRHLLQRTLFGPSPPHPLPRVHIKSIGQWKIRTTLSPQYAYPHSSSSHTHTSSLQSHHTPKPLPRVFLAGDAAHQV